METKCAALPTAAQPLQTYALVKSLFLESARKYLLLNVWLFHNGFIWNWIIILYRRTPCQTRLPRMALYWGLYKTQKETVARNCPLGCLKYTKQSLIIEPKSERVDYRRGGGSSPPSPQERRCSQTWAAAKGDTTGADSKVWEEGSMA